MRKEKIAILIITDNCMANRTKFASINYFNYSALSFFFPSKKMALYMMAAEKTLEKIRKQALPFTDTGCTSGHKEPCFP